jgi:hypothetical protein
MKGIRRNSEKGELRRQGKEKEAEWMAENL